MTDTIRPCQVTVDKISLHYKSKKPKLQYMLHLMFTVLWNLIFVLGIGSWASLRVQNGD